MFRFSKPALAQAIFLAAALAAASPARALDDFGLGRAATPDEVKAGVEAGTSIAAQAEAAGVDRQVLDDAITTLLAGRIDAAQADGRLTDEQAAKAKEHLDQVVDRILDALVAAVS